MPVSFPNKSKIEEVQAKIAAAAMKTGRTLKDITLVAVAKGATLEAILLALDAGIGIFAENRIQEAREKVPQVPAQWHLVGHLQSNKIKDALQLFEMIQSVDSLSLAGKLNAELLSQNRVFPVLLEVNISNEKQKFGFEPQELYGAVDEIKNLSQIHVMGLMGIAPQSPDAEARRAAFKKLRGLFGVCKTLKSERFEMKYLSMGMSDDFEIAIEEGSNMVRLGRALFK